MNKSNIVLNCMEDNKLLNFKILKINFNLTDKHHWLK